MKVRPGVELASLTDVGCSRENNEDSFCYWEPESDDLFARLGRLAAIADGMGGYEGGQVASRMAVDIVRDSYVSSAEIDPQKRLLRAFADAHHGIQHRRNEKSALHAMGTTCTALALVDKQLYFAHVGDSRLYLLRGDNFRQLTRDHTLVSHWLATGAINQEEADSHPQKHVLTAALGVHQTIEPDFPAQPLPLLSGDTLLLCSDGLWGLLNEHEMQKVLASRSVGEACNTLVESAKANGGFDNITVQLLRIL